MLIILLNVSLYRKGKIQVNIKWRIYKLLKNKGLCADTICFISPILYLCYSFFVNFYFHFFFFYYCFLTILQFTSYFSLFDFPRLHSSFKIFIFSRNLLRSSYASDRLSKKKNFL